MKEYMLSVFLISALVGVLSLIAYRGKSDPSRLALGIILVYVVVSPLSELPLEFDFNNLLGEISVPSGEVEGVAEEAFAEGIARAVASKFSLSEENVRVTVYGFDFSSMTAERIRIYLSGRGALADYKQIEKYINEQKIGECECEIEIG